MSSRLSLLAAVVATTLVFTNVGLSAEEHADAHESHAPAEAHAATAAPAHAPEPAHVTEPESKAPAGPRAQAEEINQLPSTRPSASITLTDDQKKEAKSLLNLGVTLGDRGDYPAAEIAYWQVLKNRAYGQTEQCDALLGLARLYRKKTAFTKAAAAYEKFLKLYPEDPRVPDALLELGRSQRAMGAPRNAISRFYNVLNSTLKLPAESYDHYQLLAKTAQFEIAETHFETGNFAEAAKFFDRLRLLDLAPEDRARAHFKSACSLLNAGDAEKSVGRFQQYIEQWPEDVNVPEARYLLALTLRKLGRPDEALAATLALLRNEQTTANTDPKNWAYWQRRTGNQLANDFFQSGDTLSAVAIYESLARLSDSPSWRLPIIYQTGLCYERLRQAEKAGTAYREIITATSSSKENVSVEMSDLAKMAAWRIAQMEWTDRTDSQLTRFFSVNSGFTPQSSAKGKPHEPDGNPAATPGAL